MRKAEFDFECIADLGEVGKVYTSGHAKSKLIERSVWSEQQRKYYLTAGAAPIDKAELFATRSSSAVALATTYFFRHLGHGARRKAEYVAAEAEIEWTVEARATHRHWPSLALCKHVDLALARWATECRVGCAILPCDISLHIEILYRRDSSVPKRKSYIDILSTHVRKQDFTQFFTTAFAESRRAFAPEVVRQQYMRENEARLRRAHCDLSIPFVLGRSEVRKRDMVSLNERNEVPGLFHPKEVSSPFLAYQ